ncbi:MAG: hypothetical protein US31_C0026G0008 [Berkelbacteria bacterium GW2011_GWA1_36_9]|uniref:Uncharacterized protein n=1 Tax=Berkelbacteria bacterium GW2011_GWA1_36_9 TaxID=1618331 RepID=A0A0G0HXQ4_9BACT|nr:MAG: hypothetical protein US31_C0026G0008 [Berkelbacteria bacterium GW2011_GWA1_36_9]
MNTARRRIIPLNTVGICEHCNTLLTLLDMQNSEIAKGEWHCPNPNCNGILGSLSFGYEDKKSRQTKWVGTDGQWTSTRPTEYFYLGNWKIVPSILPNLSIF